MHLAPAVSPRTPPASTSSSLPPPGTLPTIMVTGAGGRVGAQVVDQLLDRGMRVIATDISPLSVPREDFVLGPYAGSPSYVPFLEATLERFGVDLLIPTVPDELPALAVAAPVLGSRVAIAAPGPVSLCHDRLLTMRYLARHRIPVPITVTVRPSGEPGEQVGEHPYVARPRLSNGRGAMRVIEDPEELPARNDTYIAQRLAPGEEITAQMHRSAVDGVAVVVLLRTSGCDIERLVPGADPEIVELARVVARTLDLTGALSIVVRRSADGRPVVLEVDPKLGAQSHHAPELLDGLLNDAGLPCRAPRSSAMVDVS